MLQLHSVPKYKAKPPESFRIFFTTFQKYQCISSLIYIMSWSLMESLPMREMIYNVFNMSYHYCQISENAFSKLDNLFCVYFRPSTSTTVFAKLFLLFYTVHPVVDSLVEQFYANVNTSLFKFVIGFGENGFLFNIREADARIFI